MAKHGQGEGKIAVQIALTCDNAEYLQPFSEQRKGSYIVNLALYRFRKAGGIGELQEGEPRYIETSEYLRKKRKAGQS